MKYWVLINLETSDVLSRHRNYWYAMDAIKKIAQRGESVEHLGVIQP